MLDLNEDLKKKYINYLDNKHYKKGYLHRDWIKILSQFNYENIFDKPTMYQSVLDANPRTLLFKKRILKN